MSTPIISVFRAILWALLLNLSFVRIASAADTCLDLLTHQPYDVTKYTEETYLFMDRESTQSEKDNLDHAGGFGTTIDGVPFDIKDANNVDRLISSNTSFEFSESNRLSVLIYSGAHDIVEAWKECVTSLGEIRLWFETNGSGSGPYTNSVLLHLQYYPSIHNGIIVEQPNMHLDAPGTIPEAKAVVDNAKCLDTKTTYVAGKTDCVVKIETKSQWDTIPIVLSFVDDAGHKQTKTAFLPVRAKLHATPKPWPSKTTDVTLYAFANDSAGEPNAHATIRSPPDLDGFFIKDSINKTYTGNTRNCRVEATVDPGGGGVILETDVTQADKNGEQCYGHFNGTQVQMSWDPPQPPPPADHALPPIEQVNPWTSKTAWVRYDTLVQVNQGVIGKFADTYEKACIAKSSFTSYPKEEWHKPNSSKYCIDGNLAIQVKR
jgi:hypothetical protein